MRRKIVDNKKAFRQMKKVYELRGLTVIQTEDGKVEAFDEKGVKRHELLHVPKRTGIERG